MNRRPAHLTVGGGSRRVIMCRRQLPPVRPDMITRAGVDADSISWAPMPPCGRRGMGGRPDRVSLVGQAVVHP